MTLAFSTLATQVILISSRITPTKIVAGIIVLVILGGAYMLLRRRSTA